MSNSTKFFTTIRIEINTATQIADASRVYHVLPLRKIPPFSAAGVNIASMIFLSITVSTHRSMIYIVEAHVSVV